MKLPKRLQAIANLIDESASVADIGTDHGYLPVYLAQTGRATRIIASDVSAGSLESARRNAEKYKVTDKIEFINARGLDRIGKNDADTIVIAGIGGENILGILEAAPWTQQMCENGKLKLILQPQTKYDVLCAYLFERGYNIKSEHSVTDRGRSYKIIEITGKG